MHPRLQRAALGLLLTVLLASGCRLQVDVNVDVARDGSGAVELVVGVDEDGVAKAGGDLGAVLAVDDLRAAGWTVDGPVLESDGYTRLRIRQTFDDPAGAAALFTELLGEDGPFQGFVVRRSRSLTEERWGFEGRVDFAEGAGESGGLATRIESAEVARQLADLEERLGDALSRLIQVRVRVRLPGDVTSNATTKAANGAVWQVPFGEGGVDLRASSSSARTPMLVALGAAVLVVVVLVIAGLVRLAGRVTGSTRGQGP